MPFLILVVLVSIAVAFFAVQNAYSVVLNFIFWEFTTSLVMVILGAFLLGILVATCFIIATKAKHYLHDKKMQEEIAKLKSENARLEERVSMLQHTQKLHDEAAMHKAENTSEKATSAAESVPK